MAICKDCALNGLGWCHQYNAPIPKSAESTEHDCDYYLPIQIDVDALLESKIAANPSDKSILMTMQDCLNGRPVPRGWTLAAERHLWAANYFSMAERVAVASAWPPF